MLIFYPRAFSACKAYRKYPSSQTKYFCSHICSNRETVTFFIKGTAIALTVTLVIVFNVETIVYPIRKLRFSFSQAAKAKMAESSSIFPFAWKKTMDRINRDEKQDVLHENEPPRPPQSKLVYLLFLVVYLLVEYPAQRIALASESLRIIDFQDVNQVFAALSRLTFALILLPIFVASWIIIAIWTLVPLAIQDVVIVSGWIRKDFQKRIAKGKEQSQPKETERKSDEKWNEHNTEPESIPKRPRSSPHESNSRKQSRIFTPQERLKEKQSQDRQDRERRLQKQVSLMVNPPEMMDYVVWRRIRERHRPTNEHGSKV